MFKRACVSLLLSLTAGPLSYADLPDLRDTRVSIPYDELRTLWKAAEQLRAQTEKAKPEPPVPYAIHSARYALRVEDGQLAGEVDFGLSVFAEGWVAVPLLGSGVQIDRIEPDTTQIAVRDGAYQLLVNKTGPVAVRFFCAIPLSTAETSGGTRLARIETPAATSGQVEISGISKGMEARVDGGTLLRSGSDSVAYRLPTAQTFEVSVSRLLPPPAPSRWAVEPQMLVQYVEGRLNYQAHISAEAPDGAGLRMELSLPRGARVLEVKGEDLARWRWNEHLEITWLTRGRLVREFDVTYEVPQPSGGMEWQLIPPLVTDGENREPAYAVIGQQGLELSAVKPVTPHYSKWLADKTARQPVVWAGADGKLTAVWLPTLPATPAVVEAADAKTRIVEDGALLTELAYKVKAGQAISFRLRLPEEVQVLRCTLDGAVVNPVAREKSTIELSIRASDKCSVVTVAYTGRKKAFDPVSGELKVELPATELLIHRIDWELTIPQRYVLAGYEGNLSPADGGKGNVFQFRKELCRDEQPGIRLFYEKPEVTR